MKVTARQYLKVSCKTKINQIKTFHWSRVAIAVFIFLKNITLTPFFIFLKKDHIFKRLAVTEI